MVCNLDSGGVFAGFTLQIYKRFGRGRAVLTLVSAKLLLSRGVSLFRLGGDFSVVMRSLLRLIGL